MAFLSTPTLLYLVSVYIAYGVGLVIYRLYLSPLSRFPGPKLAAATLWYEFYYDVVRRGKYTFEIAKMHEKYGQDALTHFNESLLLTDFRSHHPHQPIRASCQ